MTVTCNGKSVVVTLSTTSAASTSTAATALKEALMASTRLDGTSTYGTYDATSNCGGQQFGEFREFTATVSGAVVTLTANEAGHPFTVTVAETMGSGTLTLATPQAATGKRFWDNAKNWDTGSVPANNDIVVFKDNAVDCCYGLPNGSLEVTMQVWQNYTGRIGLAAINRNDQDPAKHYTEYRQRYVRLDDAGTGTDIAHRFGLGVGPGSPLINLKHSTLKCTPVVYATGQPQRPGEYALNIALGAAASELTVLSGSVDCGPQDGATPELYALRVGTAGQAGGANVWAVDSIGSGDTLYINGGKVTIGGATNYGSIYQYGGVCRAENYSGLVTEWRMFAGTLLWDSPGNIATLDVYSQAIFDASGDTRDFDITTQANLFEGATFRDPFARCSWSGNLQINGFLERTKLELGPGQILF